MQRLQVDLDGNICDMEDCEKDVLHYLDVFTCSCVLIGHG